MAITAIRVEIGSEDMLSPPPTVLEQSARWLMEALGIQPDRLLIKVTRKIQGPGKPSAQTDGESFIHLLPSEHLCGPSLLYPLAHEIGHIAERARGVDCCAHPELGALGHHLSAFGDGVRSEYCARMAERLAVPMVKFLVESGACSEGDLDSVESLQFVREEELKVHALHLLEALDGKDSGVDFDLRVSASPQNMALTLASLESNAVKEMLGRRIMLLDGRSNETLAFDYRHGGLPERANSRASMLIRRNCRKGGTPVPRLGSLHFSYARWLSPVRTTLLGRAKVSSPEIVRVLEPGRRVAVREGRRWIQSLWPVHGVTGGLTRSVEKQIRPKVGGAVQAPFPIPADRGGFNLNFVSGKVTSTRGATYVQFGRSRPVPVPLNILYE